MKKLFTLFALFAIAFTAMAQTTITFDASVDKGSRDANNAGADQVVKEGVTVAISRGAMNLTDQYRCYKGETMTITSTVGEITNVEITCIASGTAQYGPGNCTVTDGTYTYNDKIGTWTGKANSIVFTASGSQLRMNKIVVTVGGSGEEIVAAPRLSHESGTYYNPFEVTITAPTAGSTIEYKLDNGSFQPYNGPVPISETTTLSARASKGDKMSEVTTAEYTFAEATAVANIAEYLSQPDSTYVRFTSPVTVLAQYNATLYVQDETGQMLIYGTTGQKYYNGNTIPAGFSGRKVPYNGMYELVVGATDAFQAGVEGTPVEPELIQAIDVAEDLWGQLVTIKDVKFSYTESASGAKSMSAITDNSGTAPAHNGMGLNVNGFNYDRQYDITAIVGAYKKATDETTTFQVLPLSAVPVGGIDGITVAEYQVLPDSANATFKNTLTVLAQKGSRLFVKDETGYMLVYGSVGQTYDRGHIIPAGAMGQKVTYDGEPELINPEGFLAATGKTTVNPEEATAATFKHDNFGHYVVIKNATITADSVFDANGKGIAVFYNMNATKPSDLTGKFDVYGIVGSHGKTNAVYQILPTEILAAGTDPDAVPEVASIDDLLALNSGVKARITSDVVAIYQNGNNLYVKNGETYTLTYGKLTEKFTNGDIIRNPIASWTQYQGLKQLTPVDSTWTVAEHGAAVEPVELPLEEMGQDMAHTYFIVRNATLVCDSTNYYTVNDGTIDMIAFNRFNAEIPESLEGKKFDVTCFLTVYKEKLQLYPVEVSEIGTPGMKGDVNGDGKVEIDDVNALINILLGKADATAAANVDGVGGIDVQDVNVLINIILGK